MLISHGLKAFKINIRYELVFQIEKNFVLTFYFLSRSIKAIRLMFTEPTHLVRDARRAWLEILCREAARLMFWQHRI